MLQGDIRPKYIAYEPDADSYKLADRLNDPSPPNQV